MEVLTCKPYERRKARNTKEKLKKRKRNKRRSLDRYRVWGSEDVEENSYNYFFIEIFSALVHQIYFTNLSTFIDLIKMFLSVSIPIWL